MSITVKRLPNWQGNLDSFFASRKSQGFQYGQQDCCLMACDAVAVITGTDIAEEFRGLYGNRKEALSAIRSITGKGTVLSVAQHITSKFAMPKVETAMLHRGDVALIRRGQRDHSLGIVDLTGMLIVVPMKEGTGELPLASALSGWRV